MGFLTEILTGAATIFGGPIVGEVVGGILGEEPPKATPADTAGLISPILASGGALVRALAPAAVKIGTPTGRMKNFVRTVVQTIAPDGALVNQEVLEGSPWLMRKDFVVMKRVLRTLASGDKKVPRKTTRSPKKDKALAEAQGFMKAMVSLRSGVPLIANIDND